MKERPILLVGGLDDRELCAIRDHLLALGEQPLVVDPRSFPGKATLSLRQSLAAIEIAGERIGPRSVYVRTLYGDPVGFGNDLDEAMARDWRRATMMLRERGALLTAMLLRWSALGVRVYNPLEPQLRITKPYQLALLEADGLPVPATLWSNDPERVREFCSARPTIYKPITGGAATRKVEPADLAPQRLARLASAPVCFQELLTGKDLRVYVLDDEPLCAMQIDARAIDFRGSEERIVPVELPPVVLRECVRAAQLLGLRFTGIDLRQDANGRHRILELNPSPMFVGFEHWAGVQIGAPLARRLAGPDKQPVAHCGAPSQPAL